MKVTSYIYQTLLLIYQWIPFKKVICYILKKLPINKEKFYKKLYFKGKFWIDLGENKKFKMVHYDENTLIENEIFWKGINNGWEKISLQLWQKICRKSDIIIDLGANTGIYSLVAAVINPEAQIFSFEPNPVAFKKFKKNIAINNLDAIINPFDIAVSDKDSITTLYNFSTEALYEASLNKEILNDAINKIEMPVITETLSTFIKKNSLSKIDLMKIDVERHEFEVLIGMQEYLKKWQPTMLIEILDDKKGAEIEQLLKGTDYIFLILMKIVNH